MRTWTVALYVAGKSGALDMIKNSQQLSYVVEMQTGKNRNLPKRSGYYSYLNHYKIQTFLEST